MARYEQLGGTQQILAGYLDRVLAELPTETKQAAAQMILKSMFTAERTKAAVNGQEIGRSELVQTANLTEPELDRLLAYLRDRRVVRKCGDEERYELAHAVMVNKVWAWVSEAELRLLDVRNMLRREMSNYQKFGHLLTTEKLALLTNHLTILTLDHAELEMVFRSALGTGQNTAAWSSRAQALGVDVTVIAREGLNHANYRSRVAAVTNTIQLGEQFAHDLIPLLADEYPQVRVAAIHALEQMWPEHLR